MNMGKRIEDPDSWDGHEVETLLACDGTKELAAVTTVKARSILQSKGSRTEKRSRL